MSVSDLASIRKIGKPTRLRAALSSVLGRERVHSCLLALPRSVLPHSSYRSFDGRQRSDASDGKRTRQGAVARHQRGGAGSAAAAANAAAAALASVQQAQQATQQSMSNLLRATQAVQVDAADPGRGTGAALRTPSNVPNGLVAGGLQVAPGASSNISNPALWLNANAPTQSVAAGGQVTVDVKQTRRARWRRGRR